MKFWESKSLAEMSTEEWESLCDNCARCCLHKLEDEDTGEIAYTRAACAFLDIKSCRCTNYPQRCAIVPDCIDLKQHDFVHYTWLPSTCAYRLLANGQALPDWHPLHTGTFASVQRAGIAVRDYAIKVDENADLQDYIISIK